MPILSYRQVLVKFENGDANCVKCSLWAHISCVNGCFKYYIMLNNGLPEI